MEKNIEIGQIVNTHALRGEVKVMPWCDDPAVFHELAYVLIDDREYDIEKSRLHKNVVILKLAGVDRIEDAELLRNKILFVPREELGELPEGAHYICDLLECEVVTVDGTALGRVCDVIKTGSNDVYVVENDEGKQVLLPVIDDVVKEIDIDARSITVSLLKGLID